MVKLLISDYSYEWNLSTNDGALWVKAENDSVFQQFPMSSDSELLVLITMLNGPKPVFVDTKRKTFGTASNTRKIPTS